VHRV